MISYKTYEDVVVAAVKEKRWENGFSKVCDREIIKEAFADGVLCGDAVDLAYESTFYTHGYTKSKD